MGVKVGRKKIVDNPHQKGRMMIMRPFKKDDYKILW